MVEYIVKKLIKKFLGDFVETELNVNVSVFSGKAELQNVNLKPDIFKKNGLPLELIYGKIGELKLEVPYANLGSKPVIAKLNDLQIVVRPITDQAQWDMKSILDNKDTTAAELAINEYVWTKYNEFKVSNKHKMTYFNKFDVFQNAETADGKLDKGLQITYTDMIVDNV